MIITEYLKNNILYLDGGMGTLLQEEGLLPGELPERWNLSHREQITGIHRAYFDAGANVVNTNTFGANILKFSESELENIIAAAVKNARNAARESVGAQHKWVSLDIGPTGKMLKPYGDLDFEDAVSVFAKTVKLGVKYGVDLITIETMNDTYEAKAAILAAKENSSLPVFVTCAFGEDGKLMTGADAACTVALFEGMGADAIGVNCSLGPKALAPVVGEFLQYSSLPVIVKPNAGLPRDIDGKTVFDVTAEEFAHDVAALADCGARIVGGCCGTTPEYISRLVDITRGKSPLPLTDKNITVVSSYTHAVEFGKSPILIGERINPTGKRRFKEALTEGDMEYILKEGIAECESGAHILDVNVGLPGIDERDMLTRAVCELQAIIDLPLQIDTSNTDAMESALRRYNGKAMINSVSAKQESMDKVFPLAKKYGGVVVALTLDEKGIPSTAEERLAIARRILCEAEKYGLTRKDIVFDPLAMAISADVKAAKETLRAVELIRRELGCHTSLGVSNVSFGLPTRDAINAAFFTLALANGLSAAIMNPHSEAMMRAYYAYKAIAGLDENFSDYITYSADKVKEPEPKKVADSSANALRQAIIKGLRDSSAEITKLLLDAGAEPLSVVNTEIIPALDTVGAGFERGSVYLPGLLMSAEAAKSAFEVVKARTVASDRSDKFTVILATVKGDIHDIGKNIVRLILENYGYRVVDLGRDVPPEKIVQKALELKAPLVGLSALMTTTVPAMEETVKALRSVVPQCKIMVGGAVLTEEYAKKIGADKYAADAMEAVRYAEMFDNM